MGNILEKKQLGSTLLNVSRLCFGTLALGPYHANLDVDQASDLLVSAYRQGVNFWDTAQLYDTYPMIREAIKKLNSPEDLVIASRSYETNYDGMMQAIAEAKDQLGLSKIPVFGAHELSSQTDFETRLGAFDALQKAKKEGSIGYIAVSMHSVEAVKVCLDLDYVDIIFPMYNKTGIGIIDGTQKQMSNAIQVASKQGKGVYAMKVLGGGHLAGSAIEAIQFVMENEHIDSIAIGMDTEDELSLNIAILAHHQDQIEHYQQKVKAQRKVIKVDPWCEGCEECINICPNNAITLELSQAKVDPEKCILCGYCASACKLFCLKVVNTQ